MEHPCNLHVEQVPGDAEPFVFIVERVANAICEAYDAPRLRLVRLDNWFGPRWLRFACNIRGHALKHVAVGMWSAESSVRVPPFVPNRVVSDQLWERRGERWAVRAADGQPLHVQQPGVANDARLVRVVAPGEVLLWFSGATQANGRGSLMAYIPADRGYLTWYVELAGDRNWAVATPRGTTKADFERLVSSQSRIG